MRSHILFQRLYKKCTQLSFAFQVNGIHVSKQLNFSWQYLAINSINPNPSDPQYVWHVQEYVWYIYVLTWLLHLLHSSDINLSKMSFLQVTKPPMSMSYLFWSQWSKTPKQTISANYFSFSKMSWVLKGAIFKDVFTHQMNHWDCFSPESNGICSNGFGEMFWAENTMVSSGIATVLCGDGSKKSTVGEAVLRCFGDCSCFEFEYTTWKVDGHVDGAIPKKVLQKGAIMNHYLPGGVSTYMLLEKCFFCCFQLFCYTDVQLSETATRHRLWFRLRFDPWKTTGFVRVKSLDQQHGLFPIIGVLHFFSAPKCFCRIHAPRIAFAPRSFWQN